MGSIVSHLNDIIKEYGSWDNYLADLNSEIVTQGKSNDLNHHILAADSSDPYISLQRSLPSTVEKYDEESMATHYLKCLPEFFERSRAGIKNYEIRINDRNYQVGDTLVLQLYDPESDKLLDDKIERKIDYIMKGGKYGISEDYVILELVTLH